MKLPLTLTLVGLLALTQAGCSLFESSKKTREPAKLEKLEVAEFSVKRLWSLNVGDQKEKLYSSPIIAEYSEGYVVSSQTGKVTSIYKDGSVRWSTKVENIGHITGATGASDSLVVLGTDNAELIALNADDATVRWQADVGSEVHGAPAAAEDRVVVLTQNGKVIGYNADTGEREWLVDVSIPKLLKRGNSSPLIVDDVVFVGHDNGKLSAYRLADGGLLWEVRVGRAEGSTELERRVDIDTQPISRNGKIYVISFQSGVMAIDPKAGRPVWFQDISSFRGLGVSGGTIAAVNEDSHLVAFNAITGAKLWSHESLSYRNLSTPVATSDYVAAVDYKGFLHIFNRRNGDIIGREDIGGTAVAPMVLTEDNELLVLTGNGRLSAYKITKL